MNEGIAAAIYLTAAAGLEVPSPRFVRTTTSNPSTWRRRFGAKNARPHRPGVVDARREVMRFDQRDMVHRFTGEVRMVNTCGDHVVFVNGRGRCIRRSCRKALQWIRNAEVIV